MISGRELAAASLTCKTIQDLRSALDNENDPDVLRLAIDIAKNGSGYGSGKTAIKLMTARLKKLEKKVMP
ncbi:MAG: hypothetical protein WCP34_15985 [Pseudomonadota bacterium]